MKTLGVDPGERRVGIALSDAAGTIAFPREVLTVRSEDEAVQRIAWIVEDEDVERIVVGLPLSLSGEEGPAARKARGFAERLRAATGLPVVEWDERLTSVGAARILHEGGLNTRRQRGRVDKVAAALLLQAYLDAGGGGGGGGGAL